MAPPQGADVRPCSLEASTTAHPRGGCLPSSLLPSAHNAREVRRQSRQRRRGAPENLPAASSNQVVEVVHAAPVA